MQHLVANAASRYGRRVERFVWACARATSQHEYAAVLAQIEAEVSPEARNYVAGIDPARWVDYAFPGNRLGRYTSNIVEIANAQYRSAWELPVVQLLKFIWDDQLVKFGARAQALRASKHALPDCVSWIICQTA